MLGVAAAAMAVVPAAAAKDAPPADQRWAVLVGINDYAGRTKDPVGALGDVSDLRSYLLRAGFREDHIVTLTDGAAHAQAIRDALKWLGDVSSDGGLAVFHFSGHVKQAAADDGDGESLDELLWAADNRFIADGELTAWMKRVRGRSWTNIAGCEAAGFDDGLSGPTRLFTAASLEHEKGYERPDWQNSVFVGLMVDEGMQQKLADANGNHRVSLHEAFRYAESRAPQMTSQQPTGSQHPLLAGGDGSEWYLSAPKPPSSSESADSGRTCLFVLRCRD